MKKKLVVLHPLLSATYPVLSLYLTNIDQVLLKATAVPLVAVIGLTGLFWLFFGLILKNFKKAGLAATFFIIIFFSLGRINFLHPVVLLTLSGLVFAGVFIFLIKTKLQLNQLHLFFNVFSLVLILFLLFQIVPYQYNRYRRNLVKPVGLPASNRSETGPKPDIYYLIFDRYANDQVLDQYFDFDNSEFISFLQSKGFYVAEESYSNYPKTFNSLASSLNLNLLDSLIDQPEKDFSDRLPFYQLMEDNKVIRFLKDQDYTIYHFGDWWQPTRKNPQADFNFNYFIIDINEFTHHLIQTSLAGPVYNLYFHTDKNLFGQTEERIVPDKEFSYVSSKKEIIERTEYRQNLLKEIALRPGPKFVFAHILLPHDPFVFDSQCKPVDEESQKKLERDEKYINQLRCVNNLIEESVTNILDQSAVKPVIIIQADEGPFPKAIWSGEKTYGELDEDELRMKFGILNAYYLPDFEEDVLYPSISPVNTFRIVFNYYFGTDYDLLEDRHYNIESEKKPYNLIEVDF